LPLRAPFPWFGGKSRAAHLVWPRFGDVANYIEPFAGSLANLLARPVEFPPRVETVNDKDAYLANFWRAVQKDPDHVAFYADWPVNETDLHARHRWLVETARDRVEMLTTNPEFFDAKIAGWWVYGQCLWIGSGWCATDRRRRNEYPAGQKKRPHCDRGSGRGVHQDLEEKSPRMGYGPDQKRRPQLSADRGINAERVQRHANGTDVDRIVDWEQRPDLTAANGRGGVMTSTVEKRPYLGGHGGGVGVHKTSVVETVRTSVRRPNGGGRGGGQGVHAPRLTRQLPQLSGDGSGSQRGAMSDGIRDRSGGLYAYMNELAARLRRVRVCCGDWKRVLTPAVTTYIGLTGVFLDPPYQQDLRELCYSHDVEGISAEVRAWALANGDDPKFRIALCGYEDEHGPHMPSTWSVTHWKAGGGYGRTVRGKGNRHAERIWFSPHCLSDTRHPMLTMSEAAS